MALNLLNSSLAKVMYFLLDNVTLDFSKTEIADYAGIGRATLNRMWPSIVHYDLVVPTRKYGGTQLYKLNIESKIVNQVAVLISTMEEKDQDLKTTAMEIPA